MDAMFVQFGAQADVDGLVDTVVGDECTYDIEDDVFVGRHVGELIVRSWLDWVDSHWWPIYRVNPTEDRLLN